MSIALAVRRSLRALVYILDRVPGPGLHYGELEKMVYREILALVYILDRVPE